MTPGSRRGPRVGRLDVTRQGEVDDDLRAAVTQPGAAGEGLARDDVPDGARAGDDEVALGDDVGELGSTAGRALRGGGEPLGALRRAVDDGQRADAGAAGRRGGEAAHAAGADDGRAAPREVAETLGGLLERDVHERDAVLVDVGLGVGPLADPQGLLEERVERLAHLAVELGRGEGVAHLAEHLGLTDGHRVEAAGDGEGVRDSPLVVAHVEVVGEHLGAVARRRRVAGGARRAAAPR